MKRIRLQDMRIRIQEHQASLDKLKPLYDQLSPIHWRNPRSRAKNVPAKCLCSPPLASAVSLPPRLIFKEESVTFDFKVPLVKDNRIEVIEIKSQKEWLVKTAQGKKTSAPGPCFLLLPPNHQAKERLERQCEIQALLALF